MKKHRPYRFTPKQLAEGKRHVALVRRIDRWLLRAGIPDSSVRSHVAVDLGDALHWMHQFRRHASQMLRLNPGTKRGADRALNHAVGIGILASTELVWHVRGLNRRWEAYVEDALASRIEGKFIKALPRNKRVKLAGAHK